MFIMVSINLLLLIKRGNTMKTQAEYKVLWIKSGAYKTIPFAVWYDRQINNLVNSWMINAA